MVCPRLGIGPVSEPMMDWYQLDPLEQGSMKFQSDYKYRRLGKWFWKRLREKVDIFPPP